MINTHTQFNKLENQQEDHISGIKETAEHTLNNISQTQEPFYENAHHHQDNPDDTSLVSMLMKNKLMAILIVVLVLVSCWAWKHEFSGLAQQKNQSSPVDQTKDLDLEQQGSKVNVQLSQDNAPQPQPSSIKNKEQSQNIKLKPSKNILKITKSPEQLQKIIKNMQNPQDRPKIIRNIKKSTAKQNQVYFAYTLSRQPTNEEYLEAEYYYYNNKYNLDAITDELPLCAVIVGRNLGEGYDQMVNSVVQQNYTNYRIVLVDDDSDDGTRQNIKQLIQRNGKIKQKISFISQNQRKYALFNRNMAIRNYCTKGDIIIDLDADDWLIGTQVFNVVNAIYQDEQLWACYFNNIIFSDLCSCPLMNSDAVVTEQIMLMNTYRTGQIWRTTELRTFRRDLYVKINQSDFVDEKGQYYKWKSDAFINIPLVELAGPNHIKFFDEFLYYYNTSFSKPSKQKSYCRLTVKTQTPYKPLISLEDQATKVQNYTPPAQLVKKLKQLQKTTRF